MAFHPVHIAFQRIDLAVMGQHPERLGQPPLREGIGGIPLVIDREGALETLVQKIGIKLGHLLGQHHALVDHTAARERADIHASHTCGGGGLLDPAADHIELALKCFFVDTLGVRDQDLFDLGPGSIGLLAQNAGVYRHMAPAIDVIAFAQHLGFNDGPANLLSAEIGPRQEHHAHGNQLVVIGGVARALDLIIEERHRDLDVDARAIARLAIRINRAPVPDSFQSIDAILDNLTAFLAIDRNDQPNAARGMFVLIAIQAVFGHPLTLGFFGRGPAIIKSCHCPDLLLRSGLAFKARPRRIHKGASRCQSPCHRVAGCRPGCCHLSR